MRTPSTSTPPASKRASRRRRRLGLTPVGVISVDLFGQPADYDAIEPVCAREGLWLLSDAAQSFGGNLQGPQGRHDRFRHRDELLPGQAARLLRRRRRGVHGRRGARGSSTVSAHPRPGRGQIRQPAHRHERPARHDPGRGPDREAQDFSGRNRRPRPHRPPLQRPPRGRRDRARGVGRRDLRAGRNTRCGSPASTGRRSRPISRRPASRRRSTTRSPCTGRRLIGDFPVAGHGLPTSDRIAAEVDQLAHASCT